METTVISQTTVFAASVLCGSAMALAFDVFRILRRLMRTSSLAAFIEDIAYWLAACILFFLFILKANGGELRGYVFIGAGVGMSLYFSLVSRFVVGATVAVARFAGKVLAKVLSVVAYPLVLVLSFLKKPLFLVLSFGRRRGRTLKRKISLSARHFYKFYKKI